MHWGEAIWGALTFQKPPYIFLLPKNWYANGMQRTPNALPLELVDTVSTIPLSAAAGATGIVVGVSVALVPQPHQRQTVQQEEPENKTSEEQ